ncbi:MAG TPA: 50S ribosomal protein L31e [Candidatus Woesearchaeota archaeon]|nr:50S ribosomal protein L31e [Candidatus Woesearchaeota archaeon]
MAEKTAEKNEKEKVFIIPIWKKVIKVPKYKRAKKAISIIKEFAARHMKTDEVKVGKHLNLKLWENGIKSPPHKVKVRVTKKDNIATVELFDAPADKKEEKKKAKKEAKETKEKEKQAQEKKEEKEAKAEAKASKTEPGNKKEPAQKPEKKEEKPKQETKAEKPKKEEKKAEPAKKELKKEQEKDNKSPKK